MPRDRLPKPDHTLVQVSDVHLVTDRLLDGVVDTVARLRAALGAIAGMAVAPEAIVLSGDIGNDATPEEYRLVRELVEPLAAELGAELVAIPGNHDDGAVLREHLLGEPAADRPLDRSLRLGDLRVVALDSTVRGAHHGVLDDEQLAWLAAELAEPAPAGTILVTHHTPLPSPVGLLEHVPLRDPERLAEVIAGTDVRIVLCGHAHHAGCGAVAGVPVWVAPAVAYAADVTAPPYTYRGIAGGAGITRVDVFGEQVVTTLIPIDDRTPVVELAVEAVVADLGLA